ncbi:hypothetical protein MKK50_16290 [Methylobacterium sp. J-043]|nr:hypothetical protein [Methylobacterium sp. J-043]
MRLILCFLSLAQIRLSAFDRERSTMLARQADEALMRACSRMALAEDLARRARLNGR